MGIIHRQSSPIPISSQRVSFADMATQPARGAVELVVVTMRFDAADPASLMAVLSKYVVLTRMQPGCRNVDLVVSVTHPDRALIVQKWDSPQAQREHFDSAAMIEMAKSCAGLLTHAPDIDLWENISAHDLA
jgi:quinol monooxygenase YgiN